MYAQNEKGYEEKTYPSTRSCLELIQQAYPYFEFKEKYTEDGTWLVWSEPDLRQSSYSVNERTLVVKSIRHPEAVNFNHPELRDSCLYN